MIGVGCFHNTHHNQDVTYANLRTPLSSPSLNAEGVQHTVEACTRTKDTQCGCPDPLLCNDNHCSICVPQCGRGRGPQGGKNQTEILSLCRTRRLSCMHSFTCSWSKAHTSVYKKNRHSFSLWVNRGLVLVNESLLNSDWCKGCLLCAGYCRPCPAGTFNNQNNQKCIPWRNTSPGERTMTTTTPRHKESNGMFFFSFFALALAVCFSCSWSY